jgi:hypothetical protein
MSGNKLTIKRVQDFTSLPIIPVSEDRWVLGAECGRVFRIDEDVTVAIPGGLPDGFNCEFVLAEDVTLTVMGDEDVTLNGAQVPVQRPYSQNSFSVRLLGVGPNEFRLSGQFAL